MKGRSRFSHVEAEHIRQCLRKLREAPLEIQKTVRADLRRREFYITDWTASRRGFTVADFNGLVAAGRIVVSRG